MSCNTLTIVIVWAVRIMHIFMDLCGCLWRTQWTGKLFIGLPIRCRQWWEKSAVENDIVQRSKFLAGSREPRAEGRELKTTINWRNHARPKRAERGAEGAINSMEMGECDVTTDSTMTTDGQIRLTGYGLRALWPKRTKGTEAEATCFAY